MYWKAVLIHAPDLDNVGCLVHVNLSYDQTLQEVIPSSYKNMLPDELLTKLHGVKKVSAVTTLSLQLNEPSTVLVPPGLTKSVSPADPSDGRIFLEATSFVSKRLPLLTRGALRPPRMNYNHLNGGMGAQERDWTMFDQPPPLPTYNQVILTSAVLGKRSRNEYAAPDLNLHPPCYLPPPWSPTEVCSSFEVDISTEAGVPDDASTHPAIKTPIKVRQSTQDGFPIGSDIYDTQSTSTIWSPAMSVESRHTQGVSPSNIVPTVFHRGRSEPEIIAETPRYQKKRPNQVLCLEEMPSVDDNALIDQATVREIIQDVVYKEKQSILAEHQEMCDEAEIQVAEAIDDGRLTIIEKTDECCDEINDNCQKIQEACEESCEMLQADVACLEEASTILKKTLAKLSSASDTVASTSEWLECRLTHPSALAAQIITNDFEHLATPDKVTMLTRVADTGYANVFLAANHELRKELVFAWTKRRKEN
ncbi:hypothetical protein D6C78_10408 [Aureobasidium pullulans]|uniref:Uncharacterized protein n=1 Tax=Aureobasidium pullulans TaxID=5580 RepID=A0A4T0BBI8_AURPU|nr:hypothetical protein D6C78_10408 [Aureobasidium pullulans]